MSLSVILGSNCMPSLATSAAGPFKLASCYGFGGPAQLWQSQKHHTFTFLSRCCSITCYVLFSVLSLSSWQQVESAQTSPIHSSFIMYKSLNGMRCLSPPKTYMNPYESTTAACPSRAAGFWPLIRPNLALSCPWPVTLWSCWVAPKCPAFLFLICWKYASKLWSAFLIRNVFCMEIEVGEERPSCFSAPAEPGSFIFDGDFKVPPFFKPGVLVVPIKFFRLVGLNPFWVRVGEDCSWYSLCSFGLVLSGSGLLLLSFEFSPPTYLF